MYPYGGISLYQCVEQNMTCLLSRWISVSEPSLGQPTAGPFEKTLVMEDVKEQGWYVPGAGDWGSNRWG